MAIHLFPSKEAEQAQLFYWINENNYTGNPCIPCVLTRGVQPPTCPGAGGPKPPAEGLARNHPQLSALQTLLWAAHGQERVTAVVPQNSHLRSSFLKTIFQADISVLQHFPSGNVMATVHQLKDIYMAQSLLSYITQTVY